MSERGGERGRSRERGGRGRGGNHRSPSHGRGDNDRDFETERRYAPPSRIRLDLPTLVRRSLSPPSEACDPVESTAGPRSSSATGEASDSDPVESTDGRPSSSPSSEAFDPLQSTVGRRAPRPPSDPFPPLLSTVGRPSSSTPVGASNPLPSAGDPSPTLNTEASNPVQVIVEGISGVRGSQSLCVGGLILVTSPAPETVGGGSPSPPGAASKPLQSTLEGSTSQSVQDGVVIPPVPSPTPQIVGDGSPSPEGEASKSLQSTLQSVKDGGAIPPVPSPTPQTVGGASPSPQGEASKPLQSTLGGSTSRSVKDGGVIPPVPSPTPFPRPANPDTPFQRTFMRLLKTYGRVGQGRSYYMAQAQFNAETDQFVLDVDANHLLQEKEYMYLLVEITERAINNPEHSWLQPVAQEFLVHCGFKKDKRMLSFRFINEPKSVRPLSSYSKEELVKREDLYEGKYQMVRTTETGRLVYLSVLNHALARHRAGRSYCGDFEEEDIYIIEYHGKGRLRCVILAATRAVFDSDFSEKILDLQKIHTTLTPKYKLDDEYPPFFLNLIEDLEGLTPNTLRDTGRLIVLPFHYSLMPPEAWGFLIWRLHLVIQQFSAGQITYFKSVFGETVGEEGSDWRPEFRDSTDDVVRGVYRHENTNENKDKFTNDLQGKMNCDRHLVQHAHHHPKDGPVRVRKDGENELFAAVKMPDVIPLVVGGLFAGREMEFKKELGKVYEAYCKFCYDVNAEEVEWNCAN